MIDHKKLLGDIGGQNRAYIEGEGNLCYDCGEALNPARRFTIHNFQINGKPVRICWYCWVRRGHGANQQRGR